MEYLTLWQSFSQQLRDSCNSFDHSWMKRRRVFDTFSMTSSLLELVAGSEPSYISVMDRFYDQFKLCPAASSFCEARAKFPSYIISEINFDLFDKLTDSTDQADWFGYTPYAIDGSRVCLPRKLVQHGFPAAGQSYYPIGLVCGLIRLSDRLIKKIELSKTFSERDFAHKVLKELNENDLVVYDRGYLSFALLAEHQATGVGGIFRVPKKNTFGELEEAWQDEKLDQIIQIDPHYNTYLTAKKTGSDVPLYPLEVRIIKYKIGDKAYMLATTNLDRKIPRDAIIKIYSKRWHIEEFFKSFKVTMNAENFHSTTENGVDQEIQASCLLWNLTRALDILATQYKKSVDQPKNIALPV